MSRGTIMKWVTVVVVSVLVGVGTWGNVKADDLGQTVDSSRCIIRCSHRLLSCVHACKTIYRDFISLACIYGCQQKSFLCMALCPGIRAGTEDEAEAGVTTSTAVPSP